MHVLGGIGKTILIFLGTFLLLGIVALSIAQHLRYQNGIHTDIEGVVLTSGMIETSGSGLHGRAAVQMTVRLVDGRTVSVVSPISAPVPKGTPILVRENEHNFGAPSYSLVRVLP